MPAVAKKNSVSEKGFPRLEDVSKPYAEACEELRRVRERASRVESMLRTAKTTYKRAHANRSETPDLEAVLAGEAPVPVNAREAESNFRHMQAVARQARSELAAAESVVANTRSREAAKLIQAPAVREAREPRLRQMLDGLNSVLKAAEGLEPTDELLTKELGSPTAGSGSSTIRTIRLERTLAAVRRLRDEIAAELN